MKPKYLIQFEMKDNFFIKPCRTDRELDKVYEKISKEKDYISCKVYAFQSKSEAICVIDECKNKIGFHI